MDEINWDDDLDLEALLNISILDFDDNHFISNTNFQSPDIPSCSGNVEANFSNALSHSSKIPSCSGNIDYNYDENLFMSNFSPHNPSLDTLMKTQTFEIDIGEFLNNLEDMTSQDLSKEKQNQLEQVAPIETTTKVMVGNSDHQYNEYTSNSMTNLSKVSMVFPQHPQQVPKATTINAIVGNGDHQCNEYTSNSMSHLFEVSMALPPHSQQMPIETTRDVIVRNGDQQYNEYTLNSMTQFSDISMALPPHPQHSLKESTYDNNEQFPPLMTSTTINGYPYMDVSKGGLYQGGMDISTCNGEQEQGFFSCDNMSMPMSMPLSGMDYQNMTMRPYTLHDSFQQHDYGSTNVQVLGDKHLQQQHNNSLAYGCSNTNPLILDISTPDESTLKIGHISPEEKKEKIKRFLQKRKERNFNKKIKYECRQTLANKRPRIRGRFAKNEDLEEMTRVSPNNH